MERSCQSSMIRQHPGVDGCKNVSGVAGIPAGAVGAMRSE